MKLKKVTAIIMLSVLMLGCAMLFKARIVLENLSPYNTTASAEAVETEVVSIVVCETESDYTPEVEVPAIPEVEVTISELPTLEEVLYHTWEESTDDAFEFEVWDETVDEAMLAGAEVYIIDSYEYDADGSLVIYWHTDYMDARLIAYADRDYRYMEANYFVEDYNDYEGDTLFFRR